MGVPSWATSPSLQAETCTAANFELIFILIHQNFYRLSHRRVSKLASLPHRHYLPCRRKLTWQWILSLLSYWLTTKSSDSPKSEQADVSSSQTLLSMQVGARHTDLTQSLATHRRASKRACLPHRHGFPCRWEPVWQWTVSSSHWLNTKSLIVTLT